MESHKIPWFQTTNQSCSALKQPCCAMQPSFSDTLTSDIRSKSGATGLQLQILATLLQSNIWLSGNPRTPEQSMEIYSWKKKHWTKWEFQDPKMEVLYHFSGHILWGYSLKFRPNKIGQTYMESVPPNGCFFFSHVWHQRVRLHRPTGTWHVPRGLTHKVLCVKITTLNSYGQNSYGQNHNFKGSVQIINLSINLSIYV